MYTITGDLSVQMNQGLYLLSRKTSYRQISHSRFRVMPFVTDKRINNSAAEALVKFQSNRCILIPHLAAPRLCGMLRWNILVNRGSIIQTGILWNPSSYLQDTLGRRFCKMKVECLNESLRYESLSCTCLQYLIFDASIHSKNVKKYAKIYICTYTYNNFRVMKR